MSQLTSLQGLPSHRSLQDFQESWNCAFSLLCFLGWSNMSCNFSGAVVWFASCEASMKRRAELKQLRPFRVFQRMWRHQTFSLHWCPKWSIRTWVVSSISSISDLQPWNACWRLLHGFRLMYARARAHLLMEAGKVCVRADVEVSMFGQWKSMLWRGPRLFLQLYELASEGVVQGRTLVPTSIEQARHTCDSPSQHQGCDLNGAGLLLAGFILAEAGLQAKIKLWRTFVLWLFDWVGQQNCQQELQGLPPYSEFGKKSL